MIKTILSAALLLVLPLAACSTSPHRKASAALPEQPRQAVRIFDRDGNPASWDAMRQGLMGADVIVIGESHGHPLGLEAAACLWDDVLATGADAALLLEFFERDEQVAIDDYLTGVTDEKDFRAAAGRTDGNYPPGHRRMVEAAKAAGQPVFAANAPRRYVRRSSAQGYEKLAGLAYEQQRLFVTPDPLVEGKYRDDFFEIMGGGGHGDDAGMPPDMIEKMYRSQQIWDATMADSIVRTHDAGYRPVVLVVGRFHADFDGGTIQLAHRAEPGLDIRTLSMVTSDEQTMDPDDVGRADYVLYVGAEPEE